MEPKIYYLTQNDCYKAGKLIKPIGVMVHSTGADNPNLKRYIGPDDGLLGKNQYGNDWNRSGVDKCVHAFIGKLADGTIAAYQTLPWNMCGWHCGKGPKGSGNDTHISFEICEDALANEGYFTAVYSKAAELCAMLCRMFGFDPLADGVLIDHAEGWKRGIASDHGDVGYWFRRFGKSMGTLREEVWRKIQKEDEGMTFEVFYELFKQAAAKYNSETAALPPSAWAEDIWRRMTDAGMFDGTMPRSPLTREQASALVERLIATW